MKRTPKVTIKRFLKSLANSNPVTRALFKPLSDRRLKRAVISVCHRQGALVTFKGEAVEIRNGDKAILISRRHAIYAGTLATDFDVYFSAVTPTEVNGIQVVDYSKPKLHKIKRGIEFEFSSFPEEIEAIDCYFKWYKPKPGDSVFDLGAHCGVSVYFFSKLVEPGGRVICFEPDPTNLAILKRNIERHGLQNVTVVPSAIGAQDGTARFSSEGTVGSQFVDLLGRESVGNVITVPVMSLRTAFETFGTPDFCKMDIESAEVGVLEAAVQCLRSRKLHFVVDTNHVIDGELTDKRVEAIFKRAGYESETFKEPFASTYARPA